MNSGERMPQLKTHPWKKAFCEKPKEQQTRFVAAGRLGYAQACQIYLNGEWRDCRKEYAAYVAARSRCENRNSPNYKYYGGRDIYFKFTSFEQFFSELGFRPSPQHSVDRKNNDGNYEPGNIRWATKEQQSNNRRNSKV
jgi:hypothetical protein